MAAPRPIPVRAHGVVALLHLGVALGFLAAGGFYRDPLLGGIGLLALWLARSWAITPTFTLFANRVETYNRLGGVRRKTLFSGLDILEARGRQLFLPDNRLPIADGTLARARDWQRIVEAVEAARSDRRAPRSDAPPAC